VRGRIYGPPGKESGLRSSPRGEKEEEDTCRGGAQSQRSEREINSSEPVLSSVKSGSRLEGTEESSVEKGRRSLKGRKETTQPEGLDQDDEYRKDRIK